MNENELPATDKGSGEVGLKNSAMPSEEYAIELKGITKRFGEVVANDNVSMGVKKGEILALLGENGSGKAALMDMISGI